MRPPSVQRSLQSAGALSQRRVEIKMEHQVHVFRIIRDTLYSDKILAVLREYGTNAWDAHVENGTPDRPIKIQLPTPMDSHLVVRDWGPGLSEQDVFNYMGSIAASKKRETDEQAGMFGIGSKAGYAYGDSFVVTSWHGGRKMIFNALLDEDDMGVFKKVYDQTASDTTETGIEIRIPTRSEDIPRFEARARALFSHFEPTPEINLAIGLPEPRSEFAGVGWVYEGAWNAERGRWQVRVGCVPYRVDLLTLQEELEEAELAGFAASCTGVLFAPIGAVAVASHREGLEDKPSTRAFLVKQLGLLSERMSERLRATVDAFEFPWQTRLYIRRLRGGDAFRLPGDLRKWASRQVRLFAEDPDCTRLGHNRDENGRPETFWLGRLQTRAKAGWRPTEQNYLEVSEQARIVVRDSHRSLRDARISGGPLPPGATYTATPVGGATSQAVLAELNQLLIEAELDGIPVVLASNLDYAPRRGGIRSLAYRVNLLEMRPEVTTRLASGLSQGWKAASEESLCPDSVFVLLDRFEPVGLGKSMNVRASQDSAEVRGIFGLGSYQTPKIYGVKTTQKNPVDPKKLQGVYYASWVVREVKKLLAQDCEETEQLAAFQVGQRITGFSSVHNARFLDVEYLKGALGGRHQIYLLGRQVRKLGEFSDRLSTSRRTQISKFFDWWTRVQAEAGHPHVRWSPPARRKETKSKPDKLAPKVDKLVLKVDKLALRVDAIYGRYPLLSPGNGGPGLSVFCRDGFRPRELWREYIRLVDEKEN